jgi:hypothetical protein
MDSFLTRSAKKLEQALGVPRPWELTPPTAIGYQLATGEGSLGERAKRGLVQFIGRYATNMTDPAASLNLPSFKDMKFRNVVQDRPEWFDLSHYSNYNERESGELAPHRKANEVMFREMFDLPSRFTPEEAGLRKIAPKTYSTDDGPLMPYGPKEGLYSEPFQGRYVVTKNPKTKELEYEDVWDISSPVEPSYAENLGFKVGGYGQEQDLLSHMLREAIAPILSPATVKGKTRKK